ncbi:hypothetical protein [Coraliomargarita parva]|uniref:hypothetical protein n=1 Tax=Coraliomargarita parva TaxID=3014050 RepID=UPI0022B2BD4A|nr:hypothetical protein [Coraliomargarita parva]
MRINFRNGCAVAMLAGTLFTHSFAEQVTVDAERLAKLEARLAELEARLADQEQETKEVKVLATAGNAAGTTSGNVLSNAVTFDILANSAWRNLRWTQAEQWEGIRKGVSQERVIELLGEPPRSIKSLKPRVDEVYYYETSIRDRANALRGRISFKDGVVIAVTPPDFKLVKSAQK